MTTSREIKNLVKNKYSNVSVRKGTGTACGWFTVKVTVSKPKECYCHETNFLCSECKKCKNKHNQAIEKLLENVDTDFYYDDYDSSVTHKTINTCVSLI